MMQPQAAGLTRPNARALVVAVLAGLLVPLVATGLFRLGLGDLSVTAVLLALGVGLLLRGGLARTAGVGWLTGCLLDAAFMFWLLEMHDWGLD